MGFTICAFLLVASFAFASPLCTPDQWEGYQGSLTGYASRHGPGIVKEFMSIHYDYTNNRSAVFLDVVKEDYQHKYQIVVRYEDGQGRLYVVDEERGGCWTKKIERPFRQACIPEEAKSKGDYYMGLSGGFKVSGYEFDKGDMTSFINVQKKGDIIIPISESVYGRVGRVDFINVVGFIDITGGIKNSTVFDVPEECESREDITGVELLTREHYVLAL